MPLKVIDRAPEARCYKCGSTDILSVCHHCTRPICARHGSLAFGEGADGSAGADETGDARESDAADRMAGISPETRTVSREFGGLKLPSMRAAVHHCAEHDHVVGMFSAGFSKASSLLGHQTPAQELPPLPVFPDVNTVNVVERLAGEVRLTDAGYVSIPQPVEGEIAIAMTHARARWQETLARYRKLHNLPEDYPVQFAAGFALLRGKAGLDFWAGQDAILADGLGLAFHGNVGGHPLFDAKRGRPQGEWELSAGYRLQAARAPRDIPLWIVPSLGATSDKRVLVIDLHWNMPETDGQRAELDQFELIELEVPPQWGNLVDSKPSGAAISAPAPGQPRIVRWRQHRPVADDRRRGSSPASPPRSMTLKLGFEKPILGQPRLSGTLRATFNRSLSGVTGINFYLPGGGPVRHLAVRPRTEISVRFDIGLGALRYQERRTVPDHSRGAAEDQLRIEPDIFLGVMPDYRTVVELTNEISSDGYYVKTVVEDHPNRDAREKTLKQGWEITGRWYEGVFPINFTISLRGTAPQDGVTNLALARTVAEITVDGTFPNAEMKRRIEDKWDGLHARVTGLLENRAASIAEPAPGITHGMAIGMDAPSRPGGLTIPSLTFAAATNAEADGNHDSPVVTGRIVGRDDPPGSDDERGAAKELLPPSDPGNVEEEIADLLRQRKSLRGRLIAGQLSDERYGDLVADINAELRDLGWSQ
jgi:hypothetical protein